MDTFVGSFYDAYDGKAEVSIAFVVKHNVSGAASRGYRYLDNRCKIMLNTKEFVGVPYMGKITKNKYVFSIVFAKKDNGEAESEGTLMRSLAALASVPNIAMEIDVIEECGVSRVDSQFWEKIKKTLRDIAGYSGNPDDWEDFKGHVKREYGLIMTVGPHMEATEADTFYDAVLEYANKNGVPLKQDAPLLKDIEAYVEKCRKADKCCVCGIKAHDNTVYPLCQHHYEEYLELGKTRFEHKHYF